MTRKEEAAARGEQRRERVVQGASHHVVAVHVRHELGHVGLDALQCRLAGSLCDSPPCESARHGLVRLLQSFVYPAHQNTGLVKALCGQQSRSVEFFDSAPAARPTERHPPQFMRAKHINSAPAARPTERHVAELARLTRALKRHVSPSSKKPCLEM